MAKNDEIDEPLVLLLETNRQQAESAGAGPAVEVGPRKPEGCMAWHS